LPFSGLEVPAIGPPGELVFWVDRGFVDFVYQAAKASVLTGTSVDGDGRSQELAFEVVNHAADIGSNPLGRA
jgi:hypothetical protein